MRTVDAMFVESYMNVSQYSPNKRLEHEAIGSVEALPSVKEALEGGFAPGVGARAADDVVVESGTVEIGGDAPASLRYAVDDRGRAHVVRCETAARRVEIPDELAGRPVAVVDHHAFSSCYQLESVAIPATVAEIREHAFMNTALSSFDAPDGLEAIGVRAFSKCARLERVSLPDGLARIGDGAFRESALAAAEVPASVSSIGHDAFKDTRIAFSGEACSLRIAPGNPHFLLEGGVLYGMAARADGDAPADGADGDAPVRGARTVADAPAPADGAGSAGGAGAAEGAPACSCPAVEAGETVLLQALDEGISDFDCPVRIAAVADRAFSGKRQLKRVRFAEGLVSVGEAAFKGCTSLEQAELPDSLRRIGRKAFWSTALKSLRIPAGLEEAGPAAFYTGDTVARSFTPTVRELSVAPGNDRFYIEEDALCRRLPNGEAEALLYFGSGEDVAIPRSVTHIGPYAYMNRSHIRRLTIHDRLSTIDVGGLDLGSVAAPTVVYEVAGPPPARYVVEYPPGEAGRQTMRITFGLGSFDIALAYAECDSAIMNTRDLFTRSRMMCDRLMNPVFLGKRIGVLFRNRLASIVPSVVVEFARNGHLRGIDDLLALGILDEGNVQGAIDAAIAADEVAAVSRLVEIQRTSFGLPMFDFDL